MFPVKKKNKVLIFVFFSLIVVLSFLFYIQRLKDNNNVIATVNGVPIYEYEVENALSRYKEIDITRQDIITTAAKEILVVQEAERLSVIIDSKDINQRVKSLKEEYPEFYELAIKQYKTVSAYKEALEYKMIYDKVKEKIITDYLEINPLSEEILKQKMIQEGIVSKTDFNNSKYDDQKKLFIKQNNENQGNRYFEEWTNFLLNTANIVVHPIVDEHKETVIPLNSELYFNQIEKAESAKMKLPEGAYKSAIELEEYISYLGYDPRPTWLPEDMKELERLVQLWYYENDDILDSSCRFYYSDYFGDSKAKRIDIDVDKGKLPNTDISILGEEKTSYINNIEIIMGHMVMDKIYDANNDLYYAEFIYNGIGYRITAENGVTQEEFIKVLKSIIRK